MESLRIALEMERRGFHLYRRGSQLAQDPVLRALLDAFAQDEARHFYYFEQLLQGYGADSHDSVPLESALAAEAYFPGGLMQLGLSGALSSPDSLLLSAMTAEEDSIKFYRGLAQRLPKEQQAMLEEIILEESRHLAQLTARKAAWGQGQGVQ